MPDAFGCIKGSLVPEKRLPFLFKLQFVYSNKILLKNQINGMIKNFLNFLKIDLTPFTVCDIMDSALLCDEKCGARLALVLWCGA